MKDSAINWTMNTFNPWIGCQKVSPGCKHCYAEALDRRNLQGDGSHWGPGAPRKIMSDAYWSQPEKWDREAAESDTRPRVFCASMGDVFDSAAPSGQRERLWSLIRRTPHLEWLLLTKRPENIARYLPDEWGQGWHNVWLGVSVEDRAYGLPRINVLRGIPAVVRFLSIEPLLEDLGTMNLSGIHWAIIGGESGTGARPFDTDWAASIIEQCRTQEVAPWVKQLGRNPQDSGTELVVVGPDGKRSGHAGEPEFWPEHLAHLNVRELPTVDPEIIAQGIHEAAMRETEMALSRLAADLSGEDADKESHLRVRLMDVEHRLFLSTAEKGQILMEYHALYAPRRKWTQFLAVVEVPRKTAWRWMDSASGDSENRVILTQSSGEGLAEMPVRARRGQTAKAAPTPQAIGAKIRRLLDGLSPDDRVDLIRTLADEYGVLMAAAA